MDQCVVDVDDIPEVQRDDEVVLMGRQGEEEISAEDIAQLVGTNPYEVLAGISARVPRVYVRDGRVVAVRTLVQPVS